MSRSPIDDAAEAIRMAFAALGADASAMSRLAWASTHSHAEGSWVREVGFRLAAAGHDVGLEAAVPPVTRVDLVVDGVPVEVKSTFATWAMRTDDDAKDRWFARDLTKLSTTPSGGLWMLTVACPTSDVVPGRRGMRTAPPSRDVSVEAVMAEAVENYRAYLLDRHDCDASLVTVGRGAVPSGGEVAMAALVARVAG